MAQIAIDGNTSGDGASGMVSMTTSEASPWWEVDLGSIVPIEDVDVWNRTDCCEADLSNYHVLVSEAPFASNDLTTLLSDPAVWSARVADYADATRIEVGASGRYLRVQLEGTASLQLAEVQVWTLQSGGQLRAPDGELSERDIAPEDSARQIQCASLSSEICFALAFAARLDVEDALTMTRGDAGGGVAARAADAGITTLSSDPRRYSFYSPEMTLLAETEYTTSATPPIQYEYVWFAGEPVAQLAYSVPSEPLPATELVWTVTDHLGTPRLQTDAAQTIIWHAEHGPTARSTSSAPAKGATSPSASPARKPSSWAWIRQTE